MKSTPQTRQVAAQVIEELPFIAYVEKVVTAIFNAQPRPKSRPESGKLPEN